jgi:hypothetical protein
VCRAAFGKRFLNAAPGTVAEARVWETENGHLVDAFAGASPRAVTAWCWVNKPAFYLDYAVRSGSQPVLIGGIGGDIARAPKPGPPVSE